jgi:organic radical activating enzyme
MKESYTAASKESYTAASTVPAKLFCDNTIIDAIRTHKIRPIHVQTNLTNKCPLNCSFCSCACRDKSLEMSIDDAKMMADEFIALGAKAFVQTGGGDPLAYKPLPEFLRFLSDHKAESALVTNGVLFKNYDLDSLNFLTWARISVSDNRSFRTEEISEAVKRKIDWSFSYVLSQPKPNVINIINMLDFANEHEFTHVRIVDDILDEAGSDRIESLKELLIKAQVDISKVIWQGRKSYTRGHKRCLIGLLKPNITPDGMVVPCCGIQYSSNPPMLDWPRLYSIGNIHNLDKMYKEQAAWDGSLCERCYYGDYLEIMNAIDSSDKLLHKNFI